MIKTFTTGADVSWFRMFQKKHEQALIRRLEDVLTKIEDGGVNLGDVFSAPPESEDMRRAA
ncbi:hypothetical protein [Candidatus Igneacidithiobacillus taiwanensis]|uniref:hypothetical protein n=1 Tax=Candidatus Igneacidithiobacillus taiwanensis TaxID=1945924 RepID=UPI002897A033|nr:hypothetical protein [Candidatus Igneacidithiobacillus taiwanensis]